MRHERTTEEGMSLVELLVALAILAVALTPLLGIFIHGLRTAEKAHKLTIATYLARDLGEEIRSLPFWEPSSALDENVVQTFYPYVSTAAQPFGVDTNDAFASATGRKALDDVDDFNGWCRGVECVCTGVTPADLCKNNSDLEMYDGKKYDGLNGRPKYEGFTRSVKIYNIMPPTGTDAPEHKIDFNIDTAKFPKADRFKTFLLYDMRDAQLQLYTTVPGLSRMKVIEVNVKYKGPIAAGVNYTDRGIAFLPKSQ